MFKVEIAKSGKILEINWDEMPETAKNYIIAYGLKQKLNDASASITKDEVPDNDERLAQKVAMAENVLESLMAGDITTRQSAAGQTLEQREATKWLRDRTQWLPFVYTQDGLVVSWGKTLEREQLNVEVWHLCVMHRKPNLLSGAADANISISSPTHCS